MDFIYPRIINNCRLLEFYSPAEQSQAEFVEWRNLVLKCALRDPKSFRFAPEEFRSDLYLIGELLIDNPEIFQYCADSVINNPTAVRNIERIDIDPNHLGDRLINDSEIALIFLEKDPLIFPKLTEQMRDDLMLNKKAVGDNLFMFEYVGPSLKSMGLVESILEVMDVSSYVWMKNVPVLWKLPSTDIPFFWYVDDELKRDRIWIDGLLEEYALEIENYSIKMEDERWGIQKIPEFFRHNETLCKIGLSNRGQSLEYAPEYFRNNFSLVNVAVKQNGLALEFASEDLRQNQKIVENALKQNGRAVQFVHPNLLKDPNFVESEQYPSATSV